MKNVLNNWWVAVIAAIFGGMGWLAKDLNINGVTGAPEPAMLGGLTIAGVLGLVWTIFSKWQAGGGKLDGTVTKKEFEDAVGAALEKLAPGLVPYVDKISGPASVAINKTIGPTATSLINNLLGWFQDKTPDPDEPALNFTVLHMLEDAVGLKGNPKALEAIAILKAEVAASALLPMSVNETIPVV